MRVLAVETSTLAGGAALLDGARVVGEYRLDIRLTHSERLMVAVDRLLGDAGWTPHDLEGLAVAVGPGSFTGLRIGLAAVKGLALALAIPVAAVPTLDAMAALLSHAALPVCPVLDARKHEVYACSYRWDGAAMRREWDYL
ncbi:MAG: tRNA (adenosine(37)-N6)-threonylcarbamoyltransferase complex dimerization subunit type 1 TsaB, partial [Candidatus Rokubacteria bacterium RIFCSPLOWO2_12_FULL_69_21]